MGIDERWEKDERERREERERNIELKIKKT